MPALAGMQIRLTTGEVQVIREEVQRLDPAAEVYLFGSRTDESARGGDIDLWVRSARIDYADRLRLQVRLKERMGWQRIDLLVSASDDDPMVRAAAETAVRL